MAPAVSRRSFAGLLALSACAGGASKAPATGDAGPPAAEALDADAGHDTSPSDASVDDAAAADAQPAVRASPAPLVSHPLWQPVEDAADDPFDHRPAETACDESGYQAELLAGESVFSVETRDCAYLTATQPSLVALSQGDLLKVRLWHFALTSTEASAEAHVALALDGEVVWEKTLDIPTEAGLLSDTWRAERPLPAGTPVHLHVHNHGENSYSLIELSVLPEPD